MTAARAHKYNMPTDIENQSSKITFRQLCEIVAKLRGPGGCPWDREQTHESLLPVLIEEAYEVAGAVRANDSTNFREELVHVDRFRQITAGVEPAGGGNVLFALGGTNNHDRNLTQ